MRVFLHNIWQIFTINPRLAVSSFILPAKHLITLIPELKLNYMNWKQAQSNKLVCKLNWRKCWMWKLSHYFILIFIFIGYKY